MWPVTRLSARLALGVALGAQAVAFVAWSAQPARHAVTLRAQGSFWEVAGRDGRVLDVPRNLGGVTVSPGDVLRWRGLSPSFAWQTLAWDVQKLGRTARLEIELQDDAGGSTVLGVVADESLGLIVARRGVGLPPTILGRARVPEALQHGFVPFKLRIARDDATIAVAVGGEQVLRVDGVASASRVPVVRASDGPWAVRSIALTGVERPSAAAEPRAYFDALNALEVATPWGRYLRATLVLLAALLAGGVFLWTACRGRPTAAGLMRATLLWAAAAGLPFSAAAFVALPRLEGLVLACAVAGFPLALFPLRAQLAQRDADSRARAGGALCVGLLIAALGGAWHGARSESPPASTGPADRQEAAPVREERIAGPVTLDAGNALLFEGDSGSVAIDLEARLSEGAVLEVRARSAPGPQASGTAFWLSSDPRVRSSFVRETARECEPFGSSAEPIRSGTPSRLSLRLERETCEARIDDQLLRGNDHSGASGGIVLLALRGEVTIADLHVRALAAGPTPPAATVPWRAAFLLPAGVLLAALVLRLGARSPGHRAVVLCALIVVALLALLPAAGAQRFVTRLLQCGALATLGLGLATMVHARASGMVRAAASTVLAGALLLGTLGAAALPPGGLRQVLPVSTNYLAWSGERCETDLAHVRHPLLRLLDGYLVDHAFRGRRYEVPKPPGTQRVLCLGGSSTWGYGLPQDEGREYPALLEPLLNASAAEDGRRPCEVINGAFQGATGARLLHLLRDGLGPFEPDVVTLSLTYNDSFALTRFDEEAYFDEIAGAEFVRTSLSDALTVVDIERGDAAMSTLLTRHRAGLESASALWSQRGASAERSPESRFESLLLRFAALARDRDFTLVLVKEPIAGEHRLPWKDEFGAVMDRVGAACGLVVVDPGGALLAAGGSALFQDEIHPRPAGHQLIAQALGPVLRSALAERR